MKNYRSAFFAAALCVAALLAPTLGFSQRFKPPAGEFVKGKNIFKNISTPQRCVWTNRCLYFSYLLKSTMTWSVPREDYCAPTDLQIEDVLIVTKFAKDTEHASIANILVVLSDGQVFHVNIGEYVSTDVGEYVSTIHYTANEYAKKIIGDALYTLTTQNIYVSSDTAKTWTIDTTGLGGQPSDVAVDSEQFVYAVRSNGLFRQAPDSNI
jgi:hypothetical protein